jgi:hypothetical protein
VSSKLEVFSRKGKFRARDVDPPLGDMPQSVSRVKEIPAVTEQETDSIQVNNLRVRVLKPDADFLRRISKRLAKLDADVQLLNTKSSTEK